MPHDRSVALLLSCWASAVTRRLVAAIIVLAISAVVVSSVLAQVRTPSRPFSVLMVAWTRTLDTVDRYVQGAEHSPTRSAEFRELARRVAAEAAAARASAQTQIKSTQPLLKALGPPPAEGQPPEPEAVAGKRKQYAEDIAAYRARVSLTELTIARATALEKTISSIARTSLLAMLTARSPTPLSPNVMTKAVPEFFATLATVARSPIDWYASLSDAQRDETKIYPAVIAIVLAAFGWVVRGFLLRHFGRDPTVEAPTYARRLFAAIVEGVARGIVPALILGGFLYQTTRPTALVSGLFADSIRNLCSVLIFFFLTAALARAVLAPYSPAWQLISLTPEGARTISRRIVLLAGIFAVDTFFQWTAQGLEVSEQLRWFYSLVANTFEALGVLALMQGKLWAVKPEAPAEAGAEHAGKHEGALFWSIVRRIIAIVAVASILASVLGYAELGRFLIRNLLVSGIVIGFLVASRGLLRELVAVLMRSTLARVHLGIPHGTREATKFWVRAALDPVLIGVGLYLIAPWWGVPFEDVTSWTAGALRGFTIGSVTISIVDIVLAVIVFAALLGGTRILQRALNEKILPQTSLHPSVQHSVSAGVGYVGLVLAVAVGITTLGFDLSNLALIAGALSVGIGFGLQNVVNNFVSGLILLIERPIKVGDWIVVGEHEGFVKRINVRATEIETFKRASVIIPNSELLSSAVTNLTYKDTYGRIEIAVGVAYGSDTEKVRDILLDCARAHTDVSRWPEPFVLFQDFGGSSLDFELRAFISNISNVFRVSSDLRFAIDEAFREAGIEIPFHQTDVHLRDIDRLERALSGAPAGKV